jgi:DNA-binding CsgD family transcriptional regulator
VRGSTPVITRDEDGSGDSLELEGHLHRAGIPCAIVHTPTKRLVAANAAFGSLVEVESPLLKNVDFLSLFPPERRALPEAILSGIAEGLIQFCQGQAYLDLRVGGELPVSGWVRSMPGGRALVALVPAGAQLPDGAPNFPLTSGPDAFRLVLGAVDHEWRFNELSPDATTWFGWNLEDYRGTALQSVVHPDDAPLLLLALGRSGVDRRGIATMVRIRSGFPGPPAASASSDGASAGAEEGLEDAADVLWVPVRCEVSPLCDHNPPRFAVAMWVLDIDNDTESAEQRAARLEDHLWRIALEIAAAGIGDAPTSGEMWWGDPALRELSQRQLEILRRLLRGERVPTIAGDLFLSQSTVRNHLSAIYRRLGVHSQAELLARLLPSRPSSAPEDE